MKYLQFRPWNSEMSTVIKYPDALEVNLIKDEKLKKNLVAVRNGQEVLKFT